MMQRPAHFWRTCAGILLSAAVAGALAAEPANGQPAVRANRAWSVTRVENSPSSSSSVGRISNPSGQFDVGRVSNPSGRFDVGRVSNPSGRFDVRRVSNPSGRFDVGRVSNPSGRFEKPSYGTAPCGPCAKCNPRFWIVSTRRCRKENSGPCCRYDQFLYENDRCVPQHDPAAFQRWLIPGAPICVVVHGSFTSFRGLLGESCELYRWLHAPAPGRPLNIVIFSWPSDDYPTGLFPIDIAVLGRRSGYHGVYLARFLNTLPVGSRVCLVGHSHGVRTIAAALHLESGGTVQGNRLCRAHPRDFGKSLGCARRYRAVFLAAAIDHHWLDPRERYGRALYGTEALLNLRNRGDFPLSFYPLRKPFGHRALAKAGFTNRDRRRLGSWNAKVRELDVTPLIGAQHMWHYYFKQTGISTAIAPYVHFTDDDARREQITPPGTGPQLKSPATTDRFKPPVRETFSQIRRVSANRRTDFQTVRTD